MDYKNLGSEALQAVKDLMGGNKLVSLQAHSHWLVKLRDKLGVDGWGRGNWPTDHPFLVSQPWDLPCQGPAFI